MVKKVLIENPESIYMDKPGVHYHFPKQYLSRVQEAVNDWVLFYESKPTKEYKSVAKIKDIIPDSLKDHYLARLDKDTYLEFPSPIPFRFEGEVLNKMMVNENGNISGRAQSAVRPISDQDFARIVNMGLAETEVTLPRTDDEDFDDNYIVAEEQVDFDYDRDIVELTLTKKVRGRAFRKNVLSAYSNRCAFSGMSFINGGGRAEVQAAHIVPVASGGNDSVRNGLALCGTAHWMFDKGFLSLTDDAEILVSRHINNIDDVNRLIRPDRKALLPVELHLKPHPEYLQWHRDECFKA